MVLFNHLFINTKYSISFNEVLNRHKNDIITSITICRSPISLGICNTNSIVMGIGNVLNSKLDDNMKLLGLKKIYHVYLRIETITMPESLGMLHKSSVLLLQKLERLDISDEPTFCYDTEYLKISIIPYNLTLEKLLFFTQIRMKNHDYFNYNAYSNNCQDFVLACLEANNIHDTLYVSFIKENTKPLLNNTLYALSVIGDDILVLKDKIEDSLAI